MLETLLVVNPKTQKSPFAALCAAPGRASRKNLNALNDRYQWLQQLPNPTAALQSIADSKVSQWANEARRLNALELREYVMPWRHTLLMATIHDARAQTQAIHTLKSKGVNIRPADLAFLSPYATSKLKRFGEYPTDLKPEAMPTRTTLAL